MTVLLAVRVVIDGALTYKACDRRCYWAKSLPHTCLCVCDGTNHGVGLQKATDNTLRLHRLWIDAAGPGAEYELHPTAMQDGLFEVAGPLPQAPPQLLAPAPGPVDDEMVTAVLLACGDLLDDIAPETARAILEKAVRIARHDVAEEIAVALEDADGRDAGWAAQLARAVGGVSDA